MSRLDLVDYWRSRRPLWWVILTVEVAVFVTVTWVSATFGGAWSVLWVGFFIYTFSGASIWLKDRLAPTTVRQVDI